MSLTLDVKVRGDEVLYSLWESGCVFTRHLCAILKCDSGDRIPAFTVKISMGGNLNLLNL